jgi:hypothetical protein
MLQIVFIGALPASSLRSGWAHLIFTIWPYLTGMALISYLGEFGDAADVIPLWWDVLLVAGWSLVVYYVALSLRLPESKVDEYVSGVYTAED